MYYYINGHFNTGDGWSDRTTAADLADDLEKIRNNGAAGPWETITDAETGEIYAENVYNEDYDGQSYDIQVSANCPRELSDVLSDIFPS